MEKRISFNQFQSVKSVAKAIDPILIQKNKLQAQIDALDEEFQARAKQMVVKLKATFDEKKARLQEDLNSKNVQIDALETGILQIIGFHVSDLVKKVIEPTGKTDKDGKPIKVTKYVGTDIVSYDVTTKQYVITSPDTTQSVEDGSPVIPEPTEPEGSTGPSEPSSPVESPEPEQSEPEPTDTDLPWNP